VYEREKMTFLVMVELLCFLQQAYKERGDGCLNGLPIPAQFCLEYILCGFLNLPTTEEKENFYEKRRNENIRKNRRRNIFYT